ncbi:4-(cytidine 5'-diphospho)-2-C-methyl-D-erythritol kinase [Herbaspirillum sp. RTI4]|nr:4-(cytidine 5'-diphospho)-2-C-methyl-D-erythritol kinase [Herbaspirillum sp. RTI4]MDY7577849.1 4-(cytidine 5'-diphospho)-2-C-methyl-D-erythritol kinase [Herbaspirillum sp. RTI4]MEA9982467.1 4-(cytidine 5'-diphospho)-2-C-methyl-D-erythritol kinase [Herbaspirillum sp. RTI4]
MPATLNNCPAPAKLNLFLHVTGRRADGYHLLQSVFQLVDYGDTLHFSSRNDGVIRRITDLPGVPQEQDLIVRAAKLLRQAAGKPELGADITIEKRLPMGGGLGGGSSDAATTLMALNRLWQLGYSRADLLKLGLPLGADVPFFLCGGNAFAEGIGEQLQVLETPDCWFVVIEPGVAVPTQVIFSSPELTRDTKPVRIADFSRALKSFGKNDLEEVAVRHFPAIAEVIEWLKLFGNARMTGSGSCIFCSFEQESQATEILKQVPSRWKAWKARSLQKHPFDPIDAGNDVDM